MKIAIQLASGGKVFITRVRNNSAWIDEFLDRVIEEFGKTLIIQTDDYENKITDCLPYSVQESPVAGGIQSPSGEIIPVDRVFILTPADNPFAIFWPQEILEACGIPCWGEEYA